MTSRTSKVSYLALAITTAISANVANAAEEKTTENKEPALEVIEVTARKSLETLQSVPVAVTSIGAAELGQNGITVITEIQQFSPNTTLQSSRGTNSTLTAFVRGVGQEDPLWGMSKVLVYMLMMSTLLVLKVQYLILLMLNVLKFSVGHKVVYMEKTLLAVRLNT